MGKFLAELVAPPADRLVTHHDAALQQHFFDIAQAKLETELPAHRALNDGSGKPVAMV